MGVKEFSGATINECSAEKLMLLKDTKFMTVGMLLPDFFINAMFASFGLVSALCIVCSAFAKFSKNNSKIEIETFFRNLIVTSFDF